jgi:hypothetical protein
MPTAVTGGSTSLITFVKCRSSDLLVSKKHNDFVGEKSGYLLFGRGMSIFLCGIELQVILFFHGLRGIQVKHGFLLFWFINGFTCHCMHFAIICLFMGHTNSVVCFIIDIDRKCHLMDFEVFLSQHYLPCSACTSFKQVINIMMHPVYTCMSPSHHWHNLLSSWQVMMMAKSVAQCDVTILTLRDTSMQVFSFWKLRGKSPLMVISLSNSYSAASVRLYLASVCPLNRHVS